MIDNHNCKHKPSAFKIDKTMRKKNVDTIVCIEYTWSSILISLNLWWNLLAARSMRFMHYGGNMNLILMLFCCFVVFFSFRPTIFSRNYLELDSNNVFNKIYVILILDEISSKNTKSKTVRRPLEKRNDTIRKLHLANGAMHSAGLEMNLRGLS